MSRLDGESRKVMDDLGDLACKMVSKLHVLRSSRTEVFAKGAYAAFLVRQVRIFWAFRHLIRAGFGAEASLLIRPFYDTMIDWFYIESDPDNLGKRYLLYQAAYKLQQLGKYGKPEDVERYISQYGDSLEEFCKAYCDAKKKLPNEWHGKKMRELSKEVGLERYYPIFGDLSNRLHNNPSALDLYIDASDPSILKLKTGPDFSGLGWWIGFMCLGLHLCLQKADKHFELDSESEIVALGEQVLRYANMHGDTSSSTPPLADEACD
jgi:hypothetical protein